MKKVVLTKEVAEALEPKVKGFMWRDEEIIDWHLGNRFMDARVLNVEEGKVSTAELVQAVFLGYEVETPKPTLDLTGFDSMTKADHERVNAELSHTLKARENAEIFSYGDGVKDGITHVLNQLKIKLDK